jgi:hypothetical protein
MEKNFRLTDDDMEKPLTMEQMSGLFNKKDKDAITTINKQFNDREDKILRKKEIEWRLGVLEWSLSRNDKVEEMTDEEYAQYRGELQKEYETLSDKKALLSAQIKFDYKPKDIKPIAEYANENKDLSDIENKNDLPELKEKLLQILFLKKRLEKKEKALRQRISYLKLHDSQIDLPYKVDEEYFYNREFNEVIPMNADEHEWKPLPKKGVCRVTDVVVDAISERNPINVSFVDVNNGYRWTSTCFSDGQFMDGTVLMEPDEKPFVSEDISSPLEE